MKAAVTVMLLSLLQVTETRPTPETPGFDWDPKKAEQVDPKHTVSSARELKSRDREALEKAFRDILSNYELDSPGQVRDEASKIPIRVVDLNGDNRLEVIAQSASESTCSPTGNCSFWVLRHDKDGYSVLLDAEAQLFRLESRRTLGYRDIILSRHGSSFESEVKQYRFNGQVYSEVSCYNFEWGDGEQTYAQPRIHPCYPSPATLPLAIQ